MSVLGLELGFEAPLNQSLKLCHHISLSLPSGLVSVSLL
jgi:hypothetical protein